MKLGGQEAFPRALCMQRAHTGYKAAPCAAHVVCQTQKILPVVTLHVYCPNRRAAAAMPMLRHWLRDWGFSLQASSPSAALVGPPVVSLCSVRSS